MIPVALDGWTWQSRALLAAEVNADGTVLRANAGLEGFAGRELAGESLEGVLGPAQWAALRQRLEAADESWTAATFGFTADPARPARDRTVWLRRAGDTVLFVAEPAVGEQERLVEKVLELNDDLVSTQRDLVRERRVAEAAGARIYHLEAIAAAGLHHTRLDEVLDEVLRVIASAVDADRAVLLLLDRGAGELVGRAAVGIPGSVRDSIRVPFGSGVAGSVAASANARLIPELRDVEVVSAYLRESSRSMAAVPMLLDGVVIGVLHVSSDAPGHFSADDLRLLEPAAERAALAITRAQAHERERNIAETLQRALLPDSLPRIDGLVLAARFHPGAEVDVGGDWYDALPLASGELALVVGDVAGKGLGAASLMGELRAGLRAYALDGGAPDTMLAKVDRMAARSRHMATVLLALVTPADGAVRYASAGHLPPLVLRADGRAEMLDGGRSTPLLAYQPVAPGEAELAPGDRLLLYTDGLVERRGESIDISLERLLATAGALDRNGSLEGLVDRLIAALHPPAPAPPRDAGTASRGASRDDIAVVALERA